MKTTNTNLLCVLSRLPDMNEPDNVPYVELKEVATPDPRGQIGTVKIECDKNLRQLIRLADMETELSNLIQNSFWEGMRYDPNKKTRIRKSRKPRVIHGRSTQTD